METRSGVKGQVSVLFAYEVTNHLYILFPWESTKGKESDNYVY